MDRETLKKPNLVNPVNFEIKVPKKVPEISKETRSMYVNIGLFVMFLLFLAFFLYNCKYGCFKVEDSEPLPYSLSYDF